MGWERTASRSRRRENRLKETPAGCMSGFLQLFDLHQRLFRTTAASMPSDLGDENSPRGVVAPRNSLKLEEATVSSASTIPGEEDEDEDYGIPMSLSLVLEKKKKKTKTLQELELDLRSSPTSASSKTANVVARLMGLDQIPNQAPSRSSDSYTSQEHLSTLRIAASHKLLRESSTTPPPLRPRNCNALPEHGTRSLPETPRASSARKSADADPRLSLQLSFKENVFFRDDASLLSSPKLGKPRRRFSGIQADENRSPRQYASDIMKQVKETVARRMARRRFEDPPPSETKKKKTIGCVDLRKHSPSAAASSPKNKPCNPISPLPSPAAKSDCNKSNNPRSERFTEKIKKLPPVRAPPKRINSDSRRLVSGEIEARRSGSTLSGPEEYFYIRCVLERTGVRSCTPRSLAAVKWYSPSHPLDPLIFHQLERSFQRSSGTLRHRCNRKLLFNLADELLADILWPFLQSKPWEEQWRRRFVVLENESIPQSLWRRIRSSAGGETAELETLVAADLAAGNVRRLLEHPAVAKETESVVSELGSFVLDSLVEEICDVL